MSGQDEREQHTIESLKRRYGRTPASAPKERPHGRPPRGCQDGFSGREDATGEQTDHSPPHALSERG